MTATPGEILAGLSLVEADQHATAQMQAARETLATWSAAKAARVWAEIMEGRTRAEIAAELGVSSTVIKTLLARHGYPAGKSGRPVDPQWVARVTAARHLDWETDADSEGRVRTEIRAAPDENSIVALPSVWWDGQQWMLRAPDGTDTRLGIRTRERFDRALFEAAKSLGRLLAN